MADERASDLIGRRIKETRQRLGLTARELADRCAGAGAPELTPSVIANIETGRRDAAGRRRREITADELLVFAYALGVPPSYLMMPLSADERLEVTPQVLLEPIPSVLWLNAQVATPDLGSLVEVDEQQVRSWRQAQRPVEALIDVYLNTVLCVAAMRDSAGTGVDLDRVVRQCASKIGVSAQVLLALGLTPPPLPRQVIDAVKASGAMAHPGDLPVWEGDGQPAWMPAEEDVAGLLGLTLQRAVVDPEDAQFMTAAGSALMGMLAAALPRRDE